MNADTNLSTGVKPGSPAEQPLRLAMTAGKAGAWQLTLAGNGLLSLSPELLKVLGLDPQDMDRSAEEFLKRIVFPADRRKVRRTIVRAIREAEVVEVEFRVETLGKETRWVLGRGAITRDSLGHAERIVGLAIEITAEKQAALEALRSRAGLERRLADLTARLDAATKELDAFCYSVSHDLRAPLRSIRGFNEVLMERYGAGLDPRGREFLQRACDSSHFMDRLLSDLLKLSRVGRSELSHAPINLSELAEDIAAELRRSEPSRAVDFQVAPGLVAYGDARLVRLLLANLLGNAWKYTARRAQASIEVGLAADRSAFFVRDNGAGFDPAYAERLFGVFQRLHPNNEFAGTGIGLAIVQRIVHRHGGRVWAEAVVDRGATFYFSLPTHETT